MPRIGGYKRDLRLPIMASRAQAALIMAQHQKGEPSLRGIWYRLVFYGALVILGSILFHG